MRRGMCSAELCGTHFQFSRVSHGRPKDEVGSGTFDSRPIGIDHGANTVKIAEHECRTSKEEERQATSVWREVSRGLSIKIRRSAFLCRLTHAK